MTPLTSIDAPPMATAPLAPAPPRPGAGFATALRDAARATAAQDREAVREAATKLVSSALVMPVLQSLRDSPFNDGPFAPGATERRFGPLLDQHLADRVTGAGRFPLVDAIVDRFAAASIPAPNEGGT